MQVLYTIQNAGNSLASDVGPSRLINATVRGLSLAEQEVTLMRLFGARVYVSQDVFDWQEFDESPLGLSGNKVFKKLEGGFRRVQKITQLPYLAFFDSFRFYEACRRQLPNYSVCHEYAGLLSIGCALAAKRTKTPYVLTVDADLQLETSFVGKSFSRFERWLSRWETQFTYKTADKLICVSNPTKERLVSLWGVEAEKIVVIPNGVDLARFGQSHDPKAIQEKYQLGDSPVVGFVGGFQPWHGLDNLLVSFEKLQHQLPDARLLLVGDGEIRPALEEQAEVLGISDKMTITGFIDHEQIPEFLSVMNVATIPYPKLPEEMWFSPLKLYEYMAAGKAIVASDSGQIGQVIRDGKNGRLVESGNIDQLVQAIAQLLTNPTEQVRLGNNAKAQAMQRHSWENHIDKLVQVYQSVQK